MRSQADALLGHPWLLPLHSWGLRAAGTEGGRSWKRLPSDLLRERLWPSRWSYGSDQRRWLEPEGAASWARTGALWSVEGGVPPQGPVSLEGVYLSWGLFPFCFLTTLRWAAVLHDALPPWCSAPAQPHSQGPSWPWTDPSPTTNWNISFSLQCLLRCLLTPQMVTQKDTPVILSDY